MPQMSPLWWSTILLILNSSLFLVLTSMKSLPSPKPPFAPSINTSNFKHKW